MAWTTKQEEIMRERCYHGAKAVQEAIQRECGVWHSVHAIEMHASRIHVSLRRLSECPECGVVGATLNRQTGMCPLCTARQHVEEERTFNALLEAERAAVEECPELEELRREYAALRQRNSRLCRKYRLQGKRGRK